MEDSSHVPMRTVQERSQTGVAVRGALLAKGPVSSWCEVHRRSCSVEVHMEEERVEVKVQEEEVEDRERHGREQSEDRRENRQSLRRMTYGRDDARQHLSQMWYHTSLHVRAVNGKKVTCEVYCLQLQEATAGSHVEDPLKSRVWMENCSCCCPECC